MLMYDHEPGSASNEMRMSAFDGETEKSKRMFAYRFHSLVCAMTRLRWILLPSMKPMPSVRLFHQG